MNAKVKRMIFSVITAMCILALTAGTVAATCTGFTHYGYVYDKDGVILPDCSHSVNITNMRTGVTYYWADFTCPAAGSYKLITTGQMDSPYYGDGTCDWWSGDEVKYEVRNADGTQTNTTFYNLTDDDLIATKKKLNIYLELTGAEESFSKDLPAGWNLISLPLTSANHSVSKVLETVSYDAVYSYNATLHSFVDVSEGAMDPGIGYFVHVTSPSTWTYEGIAKTTISTSLEPGLNMVGWLNCTKTIGTESGDALYSIKDNYYYVARWNVTAQEFETYNPVAPNGFNDFSDMARGEGYFISAKAAGTLSESC